MKLLITWGVFDCENQNNDFYLAVNFASMSSLEGHD